MKLLEKLKNYLNTASPEQLEKDWKFIAQFDNCGPLVKDFIKNQIEIIEQKVKAYDKALGRAKALYVKGAPDSLHLEEMFPVLKESEDEQHRKWILEYLYDGLRKSDEQFKEQFKSAIAWVKEQGEQKPSNTVKPKFKIGDFLVNDYCMGKVIELTNDAYILDTEQGIPFSYEHNVHLWTIQDAEDGDVLSNGEMIVIFKHFEEPSYRQHIIAYIGLDTGGDIQITDDAWSLGIDKTKPATKEQRDILFQKMKEAGYEWDVEKKELKKIDHKSERGNKSHKLSSDEEFILARIMEYLEDNDCPDEWRNLLHDIYSSPYQKQDERPEHGYLKTAYYCGKKPRWAIGDTLAYYEVCPDEEGECVLGKVTKVEFDNQEENDWVYTFEDGSADCEQALLECATYKKN